MTYVLFVAMWINMLGKYESNALHSVPGFKTMAECEAAGKKIGEMAGASRTVATACLGQTK